MLVRAAFQVPPRAGRTCRRRRHPSPWQTLSANQRLNTGEASLRHRLPARLRLHRRHRSQAHPRFHNRCILPPFLPVKQRHRLLWAARSRPRLHRCMVYKRHRPRLRSLALKHRAGHSRAILGNRQPSMPRRRRPYNLPLDRDRSFTGFQAHRPCIRLEKWLRVPLVVLAYARY